MKKLKYSFQKIYNKTYLSFALFAFFTSIYSCKKSNSNKIDYDKEKTAVIESVADNVIIPTYDALAQKADILYSGVLLFNSTGTAADFNACKTAWLEMRKVWEQSEAFLFGPVATMNIDPRIDTWPVNFEAIDSLIKGNNNYTDSFIETLEDALRGFHPIEFLLYGKDGQKTANQFTTEEKKYLAALAFNIKKLAAVCAAEWHGAYRTEFTVYANGKTYPTRMACLEEIVSAMAGICAELADGKIAEPFFAKDPSLEESPFSGNSIIDFTNNIRGVQNMYLGKFAADGKGVEDFVKLYNLNLHNKILQHIQTSITALNNITLPFGKAIIQQQFQVQNAINSVKALGELLDTELMELILLKGE